MEATEFSSGGRRGILLVRYVDAKKGGRGNGIGCQEKSKGGRGKFNKHFQVSWHVFAISKDCYKKSLLFCGDANPSSNSSLRRSKTAREFVAAFVSSPERESGRAGEREGRGGEPLIFQTPSFAGGTMDLGEKGRGVWDREEEGGHLRKHSRIDLGPRRKISPR